MKYRGGMPAGFVAAIAEWESSGNNSAISSLGEVGYLQVTIDTCKVYGIDPGLRSIPEANLFIGLLRYNVDAARMYLRYPWVGVGTADQWLFARCVSAIGIGATQNLLKNFTGNSYDSFVNYANAGGASGSTLERINGVVAQWNLGQAVYSQSPGPPQKIPAYVPYNIPKDVAHLLTTPLLAGVGSNEYMKYAAIAGAGLLAWWLA